MSALFDHRDDSDQPLYVPLDMLEKTYGIAPAHALADPSRLLVITIGPAKYVLRKDLMRMLDQRAEDALFRRMGKSVSDEHETNEEDRFYRPEP